ncbi:MAG TPA: hypothetical protein VHX60_13305 [Acidobacteriaceae bacterium]|nr:hypothetical protein [Acidobacteriaceae bacterium]
MIAPTQSRPIAFVAGFSLVLLSLALVVASYLRPVDTKDYLKQAYEGVPWVIFGLGFAAAGLLLCLFSSGKKEWKAVSVAMALLLSIWWIIQAGMLI